MARRSKSKSKANFTAYIIIAVAVIAALFVGKLYLNKRSEHFAGTSELPISDYKQNPNSFSGNTYRVTGKITERLKYTPDEGQLVSLFVDQSSQGKGNIAIRIPADKASVNLERGQSYTFKVDINREGLPVALAIKAK